MNIKTIEGHQTSFGPKILILSGIHGDELTPIYTTYLLENMDLEDLKNQFKKLTIISAINNSGIRNNTRENISKNTSDINRMFTTDEGFNFNLLKEKIDNYDIVIDVHSSFHCAEFILLNQNLYTNSYVNFCTSLNINYFIRYSSTDTIKKYCLDNEKICFTLEINGLNRIDYYSANRAVMIIYGIINNIESFNLKKEEPEYKEGFSVKTHYDGIFINPKHSMGDIIKKEDLLGSILNIDSFHEIPIFNNFETGKLIAGATSDSVPEDKIIYLLQPCELL